MYHPFPVAYFHRVLTSSTDDAIAFYKLMTELTSRSTDAMVLATEDLEFSLSAYRVVKDLVDAFHVSLNNDLEEMRIITAQHWAGVNADIQGLQNDVQSIQQVSFLLPTTIVALLTFAGNKRGSTQNRHP